MSIAVSVFLYSSSTVLCSYYALVARCGITPTPTCTLAGLCAYLAFRSAQQQQQLLNNL
jgi:hypothetical protein